MIDLLTRAKTHYERSMDQPYPEKFACLEAWQARQRTARAYIRSCSDAPAAVHWAQTHTNTGFNHRNPATDEVQSQGQGKLRSLNSVFSGFDFVDSPFSESPFSRPDTLFPLEGKTVSNIFFWHLSAYLACVTWLCATPRSVVEIGPGLGELARLFLTVDPLARYVLVDSPESLFFAEVYLGLNLPDMAIGHMVDGDTGNVLLLPVPMADAFGGGGFDLSINQGSMQEMPPETVRAWLSRLDEWGARAFYSLNYKATPLVFPPGWDMVRETVAPPAIVADCSVDWESGWRKRGQP